MTIKNTPKLPAWVHPSYSVRYLTIKQKNKRVKLLHLMLEHLKANTSREVYLEASSELRELFLGF